MRLHTQPSHQPLGKPQKFWLGNVDKNKQNQPVSCHYWFNSDVYRSASRSSRSCTLWWGWSSLSLQLYRSVIFTVCTEVSHLYSCTGKSYLQCEPRSAIFTVVQVSHIYSVHLGQPSLRLYRSVTIHYSVHWGQFSLELQGSHLYSCTGQSYLQCTPGSVIVRVTGQPSLVIFTVYTKASHL